MQQFTPEMLCRNLRTFNHHNRGVIYKLWGDVAVSLGSNAKHIKIYDTK